MIQARSTLVSPTDTPYYHCVSRCVRRAFLCGYDSHSQTDYEHRRQWLETKLHKTANIFAIKLCAYAVMSNHYHVVVHIRSAEALEWSQQEVVRRWHSLFNGTYLSQCFASGHHLLPSQQEVLDKDIEIWRERLSNLSWFMKVVNESIARRANKEDKCTGHFSATAPCVTLPPASMRSWESRFKSQALLDERALLSCMAYVDLNPIRAKMATSPETSDHTAIKTRIQTLKNHKKTKQSLEQFVGSRGKICAALPPILERLTLDQESWHILTTEFERMFGQWVGSEHIVRQVYSDKHYLRIPSSVNLL